MGYAKFEGADNTPLRPDSPALASQYVASGDIRDLVQLTQAEYDLLTPDADTLYVIVG